MHNEHNSKPRRRWLMTLKLGTDSRDAMIHALEQMALEMRQGYLHGEVASGGYDAGYAMKISEDPTVTHDSYFAAINAKLTETAESMREAPID